jgi:hypothetical protein
MNNERDLLSELIDSCRNAEDLRLPELQPLSAAIQADSSVDRRFKKSQQIDSLVGRSLREVEVPSGLEQRLLSALEANKTVTDANVAATSASSLADSQDTKPIPEAVAVGSLERRRSWKPNSRNALLAGLTTAAALLVVAFFAFSDSVPKLETEQQVAIEASYWIKNLQPQWSPRSFPNERFPMPRNVRLPNRYGWQQASASHPSLQVVCYNLSPNGRTLLFVCRGANPTQLPNTPSNMPSRIGSDWQLGSWKVDGLVYAVAVQGTPEQYRALIRPNSRIAFAARVPASSS